MLVQDRQPLDRRCRAPWSLAAAVCAIAWVVVVSQMRLEAAPSTDEPMPANEKPTPAAPRPEGETLHYSGLVKDKDTGKPIEGATVVVRRSRSRSSENTVIEETRHRTDASGTYHFTIPPEQVAERYLYIELDVEHPDYATKAGFGYALGMIRKNEKLGERPFFENVELRPAEAITGTVQTPDGNPAAGVYVLGYSRTDKLARGQFEYGSFARTSTDAAGRFRMPITTPGQGVFWLLPKTHAPEMHPLPDGKRGELGTFTLRPGVTLKGQLFDAQGKPLAGQFVEVTRERDGSPEFEILNQLIVADAIHRTAETDDEGRFSFDPLPAGTFRIMPTDRGRLDDESRSWTRKPLPGVFAPLKLVLKDDQTPEPLEIRAVPHVVIEGQWMDSQGKPKGGWSSLIFGRIDGQSWHAQASPDTNGKFTAMVPHGLERTQLDIMTNEHASFRYRIGKDGPLKTGRNVMLETLDHDVKDFQIIRYVAPIVLISARSKDGTPIRTLEVTGLYTEEIPEANTRFSVKGRQTDVFFERQNDGRYRTSSLTPDRAVKITVQAEGFKAVDRTFKLAEGKTEEAAFVLEPETKGDPAAPGEPKRD